MNKGQAMQRFVEWARRESTIRVLVLIGSQARGSSSPGGADSYSDWDFQIVTTDTRRFVDSSWTSGAGLSEPISYVYRSARLGYVAKISVMLHEATLDVVVLPFAKMMLLRMAYGFRPFVFGGAVSDACSRLGAVLVGGCLILKGSNGWRIFFQAMRQAAQERFLETAQIKALADGFIFDYLATCVKIKRGELLAAQRWIHHNLAEVNFILLQEVNRRKSLPGYPDARRLECYCNIELLNAVTVAAYPSAIELAIAAEKAAGTHRQLVKLLLGEKWQWPELPSRLRRE